MWKIEFKNIKGKRVCMKFPWKAQAQREARAIRKHTKSFANRPIPVKISKFKKGDKC